MPTPKKALLTSVTADSKKGRRFVEICRAQYNKAELNDEEAQNLNEHPGWAAYVAAGIRQFSAKGPVFPVYLEIETGGRSKDKLLSALKADDCEASTWAQDIMGKPAWKPGKKQTVKFARVKVSDLGFTDPKKLPTTREVWKRVQELGHNLCEPGDGPAIRLALKEQPRGDYFWTAMEQITDSGGYPSVFYVSCGGGGTRWLYAAWVYPDSEWDLGGEIVFRLRK